MDFFLIKKKLYNELFKKTESHSVDTLYMKKYKEERKLYKRPVIFCAKLI